MTYSLYDPTCEPLVRALCDQLQDAIGVTNTQYEEDIEGLRVVVSALCERREIMDGCFSRETVGDDRRASFVISYLHAMRSAFYALAAPQRWTPYLEPLPFEGFEQSYEAAFEEPFAVPTPQVGGSVFHEAAAVALWKRSRAHSLLATLDFLTRIARAQPDDKTEGRVDALHAGLTALSHRCTAEYTHSALLSGDALLMAQARLVVIAEHYAVQGGLCTLLVPRWRPTTVVEPARQGELRRAISRVSLRAALDVQESLFPSKED